MKNHHHYFASTAMGWATAATRKEALDKAVRDCEWSLKSVLLRMSKKGLMGPYVWTCKVEAPLDAEYKIDLYRPKDVPINSGRHHHLTYISKNHIACTTSKEVLREISITKDDEPTQEIDK